MLMSMAMLAQSTMRLTSAALPGYGASSSRRNCWSHASGLDRAESTAAVAMSVPADCNDSSLTDTEDVHARVLHSYPHWIASSQMHPVQRPLHVGQPWAKTTDNVRIGRHPKPDTVHNAAEALIRPRHQIDICVHARTDVTKLPLAEIGQHPPGARIDQGEDLLANMGVLPLSNG